MPRHQQLSVRNCCILCWRLPGVRQFYGDLVTSGPRKESHPTGVVGPGGREPLSKTPKQDKAWSRVGLEQEILVSHSSCPLPPCQDLSWPEPTGSHRGAQRDTVLRVRPLWQQDSHLLMVTDPGRAHPGQDEKSSQILLNVIKCHKTEFLLRIRGAERLWAWWDETKSSGLTTLN